jgi:hypothetical protein
MTAMYDAPRDELGAPSYAHNRRRELTLQPHEIPIFRFGTDGLHLALQAVDACGVLMAEVEPGRRTEVTTFWELDAHHCEMRDLPRSVHFFQR